MKSVTLPSKYWHDGHGVVHIVRMYNQTRALCSARISDKGYTDETPTCLQCLAKG